MLPNVSNTVILYSLHPFSSKWSSFWFVIVTNGYRKMILFGNLFRMKALYCADVPLINLPVYWRLLLGSFCPQIAHCSISLHYLWWNVLACREFILRIGSLGLKSFTNNLLRFLIARIKHKSIISMHWYKKGFYLYIIRLSNRFDRTLVENELFKNFDKP